MGFAGSLGPVAFTGSRFGAVCPARAVGAALVMPYANTEAMNLHLQEIAAAVAPFVTEMIPRIIS